MKKSLYCMIIAGLLAVSPTVKASGATETLSDRAAVRQSLMGLEAPLQRTPLLLSVSAPIATTTKAPLSSSIPEKPQDNLDSKKISENWDTMSTNWKRMSANWDNLTVESGKSQKRVTAVLAETEQQLQSKMDIFYAGLLHLRQEMILLRQEQLYGFGHVHDHLHNLQRQLPPPSGPVGAGGLPHFYAQSPIPGYQS